MHLTPAEAAAIDAQVAAVEARTGTQVVVAVIGKADAYVELPWIAFALGASLAALALVVADAWRPDWATGHAALRVTVTMLGAGAACALAAVFVPAFARLFLRPSRRDVEVRQHAQSLFLERELFRTRGRTGILLLVSVFERRIELLPDRGCRDHVGEADWHDVVARMAPLLRERRPADALQEGLAALAGVLERNGFRAAAAGDDELPNRPIDERGA
jgi:putative membrane protein